MKTSEQPFHFIVMDSDKLERLLSFREGSGRGEST